MTPGVCPLLWVTWVDKLWPRWRLPDYLNRPIDRLAYLYTLTLATQQAAVKYRSNNKPADIDEICLSKCYVNWLSYVNSLFYMSFCHKSVLIYYETWYLHWNRLEIIFYKRPRNCSAVDVSVFVRSSESDRHSPNLSRNKTDTHPLFIFKNGELDAICQPLLYMLRSYFFGVHYHNPLSKYNISKGMQCVKCWFHVIWQTLCLSLLRDSLIKTLINWVSFLWIQINRAASRARDCGNPAK